MVLCDGGIRCLAAGDGGVTLQPARRHRQYWGRAWLNFTMEAALPPERPVPILETELVLAWSSEVFARAGDEACPLLLLL